MSCGRCGKPIPDTVVVPHINGQPYCDRYCYEEALFIRGLTMRPPREDTLPGLEERT